MSSCFFKKQESALCFHGIPGRVPCAMMWPFLFCIFLGKLHRRKSRTTFSKLQTVENLQGRLQLWRLLDQSNTNRMAAVPAKFAKNRAVKQFLRVGKRWQTSRNHRKSCPGFPFLTKSKIATAILPNSRSGKWTRLITLKIRYKLKDSPR